MESERFFVFLGGSQGYHLRRQFIATPAEVTRKGRLPRYHAMAMNFQGTHTHTHPRRRFVGFSVRSARLQISSLALLERRLGDLLRKVW